MVVVALGGPLGQKAAQVVLALERGAPGQRVAGVVIQGVVVVVLGGAVGGVAVI
jgi:hypothetical protein